MLAAYTAILGHDSQSKRVRLGGMALRNGIFVHSLDHWAAAVRDTGRRACTWPPGASRSCRQDCSRCQACAVLLRMAEMGYLLPIMRRRLPEARLPVEGAAKRGRAGAPPLCVPRDPRAAGFRR